MRRSNSAPDLTQITFAARGPAGAEGGDPCGDTAPPAAWCREAVHSEMTPTAGATAVLPLTALTPELVRAEDQQRAPVPS